MSFQATIVLDGSISKFPYPLFPKFRYPYNKGYRFEIPAVAGDHDFILNKPNVDLELLMVTFSASGYKDTDSWSILANGHIVYDTIYTKEVGQVKPLSSVKRILTSDAITFTFHNDSGTSKVLWVDLDFMAKTAVI